MPALHVRGVVMANHPGMPTLPRVLTAASLLAAVAAPPLHAQARSPLQDATTVRCEFPFVASGNWGRDGAPTAAVKPVSLKVGFLNVDTEVGEADVEGLSGALPIVARFAGTYLHFMRVDSSGFLHATTVFDKVSRPGRLRAVHSRHEYTDVALPGFTSRPEQYYGDCEVS